MYYYYYYYYDISVEFFTYVLADGFLMRQVLLIIYFLVYF